MALDIVKRTAAVGLAALLTFSVGCSTPPPKRQLSTQQKFLHNPARYGVYDLGNGVTYELDRDGVRLTLHPSGDRKAFIEVVGDKDLLFNNQYADRISVYDGEVDVVATAGVDVSYAQTPEEHGIEGVRGSPHSAEFGVRSQEYDTHRRFFNDIMHLQTTRLVNGVLSGRIHSQQAHAHADLKQNEALVRAYMAEIEDHGTAQPTDHHIKRGYK